LLACPDKEDPHCFRGYIGALRKTLDGKWRGDKPQA